MSLDGINGRSIQTLLRELKRPRNNRLKFMLTKEHIKKDSTVIF